MTCGKIQIQSCGFLWFLSTVYLIRRAVPKVPDIRRPSSAIVNLVIQRPHIAGGSLTIPLDSSVNILPCFGKERYQNTLRLEYGDHGKCIVMRTSSAVELQKWATSIMAAVAASQVSAQHVPASAYKPRVGVSKNLTTKKHSRQEKQMEATQRTNGAKAEPNCSPQRIVQQNVPSVMQFFIAAGQIIASAS